MTRGECRSSPHGGLQGSRPRHRAIFLSKSRDLTAKLGGGKVSKRLVTMPRHRFADTRDRIKQAAVRLFVEKGVAETSVRDIARAVGLSEGGAYPHFPGKDEVGWTAVDRHA